VIFPGVDRGNVTGPAQSTGDHSPILLAIKVTGPLIGIPASRDLRLSPTLSSHWPDSANCRSPQSREWSDPGSAERTPERSGHLGTTPHFAPSDRQFQGRHRL